MTDYESYADRKIAEAELGGDTVKAAYWRRVRADVDKAPPFSPALRDRLAVLLRDDAAAPIPQDALRRLASTPQVRKPPPPVLVAPPRATAAPPQPVSVVYLLANPDHSRVKIGTSTDLKRRSVDIGRMSPVPLQMLWSTAGGQKLERALHEQFRHRRLHGEWFDFTGRDVVAEVSTAAARLDHGESGAQ